MEPVLVKLGSKKTQARLQKVRNNGLIRKKSRSKKSKHYNNKSQFKQTERKHNEAGRNGSNIAKIKRIKWEPPGDPSCFCRCSLVRAKTSVVSSVHK